MKSNQESQETWEEDGDSLTKSWRFLECWWKDNRPLRGDSHESNVIRFRTLQRDSRELLAHIESVTGARLHPFTRSIEMVRETDTGPGEGFILWLLVAQVLAEAVRMVPRRIVSGLTGVDIHHREGHPRCGRPCPKENPEVASYRALRLAFYWLRRAPKRLASIVQGNLANASVLPTLKAWALTRVSLSHPRLLKALEGENFDARFSASLALAIGEHRKADPFVGEESVLRRALNDLEKEAPEDVLHERAVPLGSLDAQDEDDFALRLELREELAKWVERAGLTPAEKEVAYLRLFEGLEVTEKIASRTRRKKSTARVHWANAKKKLKKLPKEIWEVFRIS